MHKARLEAFSDGVIAIILTIMVLELKVPKAHSLDALTALWPVFAAYLLSYLNVFLVWLNHHNIFAPMQTIDRPVLLANGLLLLATSLVPFATAFAGEAHWQAPLPSALYGLVMLAVSLAFVRLRIVASRCTDDPQAKAAQLAESRTSLVFAAAFALGAGVAVVAPRWTLPLYAVVPLIGQIRRGRRAATHAA